ncbi:hypothetical protein [Methylomonas sp. CM2]|uniref:hypothetical protein n=1 Tax=Methylomonas sp. CM2 TaxID=3417647 RepID=UPI003CF645D2
MASQVSTKQSDIDYIKYLFSKEVIKIKEGYLVDIHIKDNSYHGFSIYTVKKQAYLDYLAVVEAEKEALEKEEAAKREAEKSEFKDEESKIQQIKFQIESLKTLERYLDNEVLALWALSGYDLISQKPSLPDIDVDHYHDLMRKGNNVFFEICKFTEELESLKKEEWHQQEIQRLFYDKELVTEISSEEETKEIFSFVDSLQPGFLDDYEIAEGRFRAVIWNDVLENGFHCLELRRYEFVSCDGEYESIVRRYRFLKQEFVFDYFLSFEHKSIALTNFYGVGLEPFLEFSAYSHKLYLDELIYVDDEIEDFCF